MSATAVPPGVPCPACAAALGPAADRCAACGVSLAGPAASELWQLDRQLASLQQRRGDLQHQWADLRQQWVDLQRRRAELLGVLRGPVRPEVATAVAGPPGRVVPARPRWAAQQVLLGVGALLVLVAAVVFLAVAWSVIGVAGQVTVMALVTLAAGAGSVLLARRGLRASREALAVLTVGLALLDGAAAHRLDLAGLGAVDPVGYAAAASAALALVLVAVSPPALRPSATSFRLAAVAAAAAAPLLALAASEPGLLEAVLVCAVVAGLSGWASRRLPGGWAPYRPLLSPVFGAYLVLTWALGLAGLSDRPVLGSGGLGPAVALLVAVGAGRAGHLHRGLRPAARTHPLLAASALLAGAVHLVALAWDGGVGVLAVLGVVAALATVLACASSVRLEVGLVGVTAAAGQLVAGLAMVLLGSVVLLGEEPRGPAACTAALAGFCCSAAVLAVIRPAGRPWSTGWSAATGAAAVAAATSPLGGPAVGYALTAAAVVLAVVAARLTDRPERVTLAVAAGTGLLAAVLAASAPPLVGQVGSLPPLTLVLAALGLTALAYGIRPRRGAVAWLGVLLCSAGNAVRFAGSEVAVVEAYSLPLAALALLVGLVRLHRQPDAPSWVTVGPAVGAALLPSALATVGDPALTRPLVVLAAAAAVMVLGVRMRWQAPFLSGAVAAGVVAVAQLAPYAVGAPRWLSFGAVGIVLLVVGARYEQRRQNASQAVHWVAALR